MDIQVSDAAASFDMIVMVDWSAAASRGPARPIPDRCWSHGRTSTIRCRHKHGIFGP
jgi:hypothetical protein